MSLSERTGSRDLSYSRWHRPRSLSRFIAYRLAVRIGVIDIDWCEYCMTCHRPLALIETQRSKNAPKSAAVTMNLANMAGIPAYSVSYSCTTEDDIDAFRLQQIAPTQQSETTMSPDAYATFLLNLHISCDHGQANARTA